MAFSLPRLPPFCLSFVLSPSPFPEHACTRSLFVRKLDLQAGQQTRSGGREQVMEGLGEE